MALSIYVYLSYIFDWEHLKKAHQKGIPYSKFDKIMGYCISIVVFVLSLYLLFKSI